MQRLQYGFQADFSATKAQCIVRWGFIGCWGVQTLTSFFVQFGSEPLTANLIFFIRPVFPKLTFNKITSDQG